jgi:hypothetical protein
MFNEQSSGLLGMTADPGLVSLLASMEPKQRQHYVAQHSDDINVVIMGKVVSDIANKLDIAKKGAQPGIKPTVLAQTIASMAPEPQVQPQVQQQVMPLQGQTRMAADGGYMDSRLPEDMGIGALPERSLSGMADGGIVGFSGAAESLVRSYTGGKDYFLDIPETVRDPSVPYYRMIPNPLAALAGRKFGSYDEAVQAYNTALYDPAKATRREQYAPPSVATMPTDDTRRGGMENDPRMQGAPLAAPPTVTSGAPSADASPRRRPADAAAPPAGAPASGLQTLLTSPDLTPEAIAAARKKFTDLQPPVVDTLKTERQQIVDAEKASGLEALQQQKDRVAKQGDPYAKQEERANKQEASVAESAERNPYLALMEAGFAAMSGDSPYAFVNLGKGALAGTKTYREGLALIEKAKEKLSETRDRIDGLRLIRSDLNDKEERDILNENRKTALEGTRFMFAGLEKATGESKAQIETNLKIFTDAQAAERLQEGENARTVFKDKGETTRNRESNAAAGARSAASSAVQMAIAQLPGAQERLFSVLGSGDVKKGFKYWSEATAESKGDEAIALALAKDPLLLEGLKTSNPAAYAAFMSRMSGDAGFKVTGSRPAN